MKTLLLTLTAAVFFAAPAFAGDGHDHGDSAFLQGGSASSFDLSDYQIKNLGLETDTVKEHKFYETVKMPVVLRKSAAGWTAQGFMYEGKDILRVKAGQKATIYIDAMEGQTLNGKINRTDDLMDPKTRLFSAHAQISSPVPANAQGLKGEMVVQTTYTETAPGVPSTAVQGEFGNYFVFVKHGSHFERTPILLGHVSGGIAEVLAGVEKGETVVTKGSYQLQYVTGTDEHDHEDDAPAALQHAPDCDGAAASHEDEHSHAGHNHDDHNHAHDAHHSHGKFMGKLLSFFGHKH